MVLGDGLKTDTPSLLRNVYCPHVVNSVALHMTSDGQRVCHTRSAFGLNITGPKVQSTGIARDARMQDCTVMESLPSWNKGSKIKALLQDNESSVLSQCEVSTQHSCSTICRCKQIFAQLSNKGVQSTRGIRAYWRQGHKI